MDSQQIFQKIQTFVFIVSQIKGKKEKNIFFFVLYLDDRAILNVLGLLLGSWQLEGKYVVRISNFSVVPGADLRFRFQTEDDKLSFAFWRVLCWSCIFLFKIMANY